jgi:hypothetical protein
MAGPASSQTPSPAKLLATSLAACRAESSVQWISSGSLNGESGTITTTSGRTTGIQMISVTKGGSTGHVTVELTNNTGYIKGDSFALHIYMGFTSAAAKKEANRWLSLAPSNPDFSAVTAGLTVSSIASELEMTAPFTTTPQSVVLGEHVDGVRGLSKAQSGVPAMKTVLYFRAKGLPLPVEQTQVYEGHTSAVKFVKWNVPTVLESPSGAIPLLVAWLQ